MQKSTVLMVVSIIMIVFGAIALLTAVPLLLAAVAAFALSVAFGSVFGAILAVVAGILSLAISLIELLAGIFGIMNYQKPEKADSLRKVGMILIGLQLIGLVFSLISSFSFGTIIFGAIGLVLPVLYYMGANELKTGKLEFKL